MSSKLRIASDLGDGMTRRGHELELSVYNTSKVIDEEKRLIL